MKNKKAISALVATVLLILITVAGVAIIWGAVMPMITKITQSGQACMNARLMIDTTSGYTCYSDEKKQASIMISRGAEEFELTGIQLGLSSAGTTKSITIKEGISAILDLNFDENSGNTTYDFSINRNDGKIYGASWVDGKIGKGLSFDGVDDYVQVTNPTEIKDAVTVSMWVRPDISELEDRFIMRYGHNTSSFFIHHTRTFGKSSLFYVYNESGAYQSVSVGELPINTWTFIAFTYDSAGNVVNSYIKGTFKESKSFSGKIRSPVGNLIIGASTPAAALFDGTIDQVKIYNRALSEGEIKQHYEAENAGKNLLYSELPNMNAAKTYIFGSEDVSEVSVAPIVKVGNTEKICDISAKISMPKCAS